jgi:hypothetical protein
MPIMTYGGFRRMTGFCKTKVRTRQLARRLADTAYTAATTPLVGHA